jgi:hypothetical protein
MKMIKSLKSDRRENRFKSDKMCGSTHIFVWSEA